MATPSSVRVFLISPARVNGPRALSLRKPTSSGALATALRTRDGAPIGDVFQYLSGLYFRGKVGYARRFAQAPSAKWIGSGALVITSNRGLVPAETRITMDHLEAFAETDIHQSDKSFRVPFVRDAELLRTALGGAGECVLLGSVAQGKYTAPLLDVFGDRLLFPNDFVGRGDMSRGGLLLRAIDAGTELSYVKVRGALLHGAKPPKLSPRAANR